MFVSKEKITKRWRFERLLRQDIQMNMQLFVTISKALKVLKEELTSQEVDMFEFSLMHSFFGVISPSMQADWKGYKFKVKQEYSYDFEKNKSSEAQLPLWTSGRTWA
ncbi:unnamed protein product [Lepeophtheirus salmonis]|uniref:(salmon louse) hypothetical protein n=1 Tax=Lepeophtheirus salmonis TaxID=72036 RepID=A0A817F8P1_LEPSM|nr:unnamed protein product [Lepeophtheirus salmonis]CAG9475350.1 unnamed protein product [Lepeophtheirus salmonis]